MVESLYIQGPCVTQFLEFNSLNFLFISGTYQRHTRYFHLGQVINYPNEHHLPMICVIIHPIGPIWIPMDLHMGVSENSVPLNPMVLLIIIPFLNDYFIGNIPNIFRQTHMLSGCFIPSKLQKRPDLPIFSFIFWVFHPLQAVNWPEGLTQPAQDLELSASCGCLQHG